MPKQTSRQSQSGASRRRPRKSSVAPRRRKSASNAARHTRRSHRRHLQSGG